MGERGIVLVGLNHRTAPVELRERLAFENGDHEQALRRLMAVEGVAEGAIVSTCNRVEVVACGASPESLGAALPGYLAREHGVSEAALGAHLYTHVGRDAVRHLFRVAASLDSMVVGEPQILGQVKQSVRTAEGAGTLGSSLNKLFQQTFAVAKQVRTETALGAQSISMAAASLKLAQNLFGDLSRTHMMLVGVGEMVELAATYFAAQQPRSIVVANRTLARGESFAERFNAKAISIAEIPETLYPH